MKKHNMDLYLGIDVQTKPGCSYYIVNSGLEYVDSGGLMGHNHDQVCRELVELKIQLLENLNLKIAVGIDAPRMGLITPRKLY